MSKSELRFDRSEITVGCDAELPAFYNNNGMGASLVGLIGGKKGRPVKCEGGGYLADGVMAEMNVDPVPGTEAGCNQFVININLCMDAIGTAIYPHDLNFKVKDSVEYHDRELQTKQSRESGCDKTIDAYSGLFNQPEDLGINNFRYAGGDIHLGWPNATLNERVNVVRILDAIFAAAEVESLGEPSKRSSEFGVLGKFREKPYGIEYKTVGNFWLQSEELIRWAFDAAITAVERGVSETMRREQTGWEDKPFVEDYVDHIRHARGGWNRNAARRIYTMFTVPIPVPKAGE
jgi:hypothetical protein